MNLAYYLCDLTILGNSLLLLAYAGHPDVDLQHGWEVCHTDARRYKQGFVKMFGNYAKRFKMEQYLGG